MMKVAVLGASGLIGRALVEQLNRDGHRVTAVSRKPLDEWGYRPDCMAWGETDLSKDTAFHWLADEEWVFHVAADTGGRMFTDGQEAACAMNTLIDMQVLKACVAHKSVRRVFYASSACVYGLDWPDEGWREGDVGWTDPPEDMYGKSKLYAEEAYEMVGQNAGLEVRIGRLDGVFGPGAHWNDNRAKAPMALLRKAIEAKRHGTPIEVWGDGKQIRAYLSSSDAAVAITRLMASGLRGPVNIGAELVLDMDALARLCADTAGVPETQREIVHVPDPTGPQRRFLSMAKIKNAKVWTPPPLSTALGLYAAHKWLVEQMEMAE